MPGARVRTTAGMYATVVSVEDQDVVLEVAPGVNVRYLRRAILDVVSGAGGMPLQKRLGGGALSGGSLRWSGLPWHVTLARSRAEIKFKIQI